VSWFCRAGLSAVVVGCAVVLVPVTALARYPDDNGHHYGQLYVMGHHYGQLKHQQAPPPAPVPPPVHGKPGGSPSGGGDHGPAVGGGGSSTGGDESSIPEVPVMLPLPGGNTPQVDLVDSSPGRGGFEWLLLLILPLLAAVWLTAMARFADKASKRRSSAPA
jgi:hypothetical protein